MSDARIDAYARLLVERCLGVQPGWQVVVRSSPLARPLVEEVVRLLGRAGAYPLLRIVFNQAHVPVDFNWAREAPEALLSEQPSIERHAYQHMDAYLVIFAPENTREGSDVAPLRHTLLLKGLQPLRERTLGFELPWVGCQFACPALAQDAGMSLAAFEDFLFGACLLDWDAEGEKMRRIADRFDRASELRIVGDETDLTLSVEGRNGHVDDAHVNMPGGEVFYSPVEDSAEGVVTFSEFPAVYLGYQVERARLAFRDGRVVDASAAVGEDYLCETLDTDDGARVLGELGIGCNPGIRRYARNTLFDEKIYGTVHLAVGAGFPFLGGKNRSSVHWDIVKDLRPGGQIYCDGELVQENGEWRF